MTKARFLIAIGIAWMVPAGLLFWKGSAFPRYMIQIPGWLPFWVTVGILYFVFFVLLFGWAIPLAIGVRMFLKRR